MYFLHVASTFRINSKYEAEDLVFTELRVGSGFKRRAIVDIVPTGSYQATLSRIGLYGVGFEGVPVGTV